METTSSRTMQVRELAEMIDHTLLRADASYEQIEELCTEAWEHRFASVCVHPIHIARCRERLEDSSVKVCSVVGFPLGANLTSTKTFETEQALVCGANEIDMVINIGALKSGDFTTVQDEIAEITEICHKNAAACKVIIETCLLSDTEKITACRLAQASGADFVKTSTGFSTGGATESDVRLMRETVGPDMGVKAAGGIRTLQQAQAMIAAGANRIGTSSGVSIVNELKRQLAVSQ